MSAESTSFMELVKGHTLPLDPANACQMPPDQIVDPAREAEPQSIQSANRWPDSDTVTLNQEEPKVAGAPLEPPRKIAIVGKAPSSRHLAPDNDESWEIWTLSDLVPMGQVTRFDLHCEIHPIQWLRAERLPYYEWLKSIPREKTLLLRSADPEIPAGQSFPIRELLQFFRCRYWTNTVSYLIGLAIIQRPAVIGIWGVDMAQNGARRDAEYREQRPSCEWLIGWAQGAGIEVVIPPECDLMKTPYLYGFEQASGAMRAKWEARNTELDTRIRNQMQKLEAAQRAASQHAQNVAALEGAKESQQYYEQWCFPDWEAEVNGGFYEPMEA